MRLQKKDVWKLLKKKRKKLKGVYISEHKGSYEQFGRKMNKDDRGKKKLFWKEVSKTNRGKVESCSRIKDRNGGLAMGEDEVRRIWEDCFEELYTIETQIVVHKSGFDGIHRITTSE